jgi:hypothetical protein
MATRWSDLSERSRRPIIGVVIGEAVLKTAVLIDTGSGLGSVDQLSEHRLHVEARDVRICCRKGGDAGLPGRTAWLRRYRAASGGQPGLAGYGRIQACTGRSHLRGQTAVSPRRAASNLGMPLRA